MAGRRAALLGVGQGVAGLVAAAVAATAAGVAAGGPALAGPVVCTSSIEAPRAGAAPVEITRCSPVTTAGELMERRFYSYTAPFARGVDITHQVTDWLGIAMGGGDGTKVMGLGFPDQTIIWDGSAVENTYQVLLEQQSNPMPWRTADINNGFCGSLPQGSCGVPSAPVAWPQPGSQVVRGLW